MDGLAGRVKKKCGSEVETMISMCLRDYILSRIIPVLRIDSKSAEEVNDLYIFPAKKQKMEAAKRT